MYTKRGSETNKHLFDVGGEVREGIQVRFAFDGIKKKEKFVAPRDKINDDGML